MTLSQPKRPPVSPLAPLPPDQTVLRMRRVTRQYGARVALLDATFDLQPGVVGLLGPNGAGKSTLIHVAAGLLAPTRGEVTWLGNLKSAEASLLGQIALVPDGDSLPRHDTALSLVTMILQCQGLVAQEAEQRARSMLSRLGMEAKWNDALGTLSRGQRQRVKLAQAFAMPARLVLLDEPLNALDPMWRIEVASLMHEAAKNGACVLVSSHILEEVQSIAGWLLLLFRGRVVAAGSQAEIRALLHKRAQALRLQASDPRALARELLARAPVTELKIDQQQLIVQAAEPSALFAALPAAVLASGATVDFAATDGDDLVSLFQALAHEVK